MVRRAAAGFTLIEMLVVLIIMALLSGVAILAWPKGRSDDKLVATAADTLARQLARLRSQAVAESRPITFAVQPADSNSGEPYGADLDLVLLEGNERRRTGMIRFAADGSSPGGRLLLSKGESRRIVEVSWPLGRIAVLRPAP